MLEGKELLIDYEQAFEDQKGIIPTNQPFAVLYCTPQMFLEPEQVDVDVEFNFVVPVSWLCKKLELNEKEVFSWIDEQSTSSDTEDIFWEAIKENVVISFTNFGITGYYS